MSSSNRELALAYLEDAEYAFEEAMRAYKRRLFHRTIRRAQECVELSLKALLRLYGVEYPRTHEVSSSLMLIKDKLPEWLRQRLDYIVETSIKLSLQRAPSFYGDEIRGIPAKRLFNEEDATDALKRARIILELVKKLIEEWSQVPS